MTFHEAESVFGDVVKATAGDEALRPLYREFLLLAVRYARARTDWRLALVDERRAMDAERSTSHNALIDASNILSRACGRAGRPNDWRRKLGEDRKDIGDFACHVHAILGVEAR